MPRWSRRWQAGEDAKEQLKVILDDVSKRIDWPKGSPEQLIGDYYGSCMDQAKIDKLGIAPAQTMLTQIDAIKSPADLQRMIRQLQSLSVSAPFGMGSAPDNHNPGQTIATIYASGIGLPDRDYYLKPDQRFQEAREKYATHVTNMFKLAGYNEASAKAAATTVFDFEKKLAEASLDNVALRDPQATDHKTSFDALTKMAPSVDWAALFTESKISRADLNVTEPKFLAQVDKQLHDTPLQDWKTYLKWQFLHASADSLSSPFVNENFAFYGQYISGSKELKPRWKRCAESTDALLGDALGKKYVGEIFSTSSQGPCPGNGHEYSRGHA